MDPNSLQNVGDVVTKFDSVLESAKQNLISGIISTQFEAYSAKITALKRKDDEKRVHITNLNKIISKLTEEKVLAEASLKSALESKIHVESQLREELKQQRELIVNLRLELEVAQLTPISSQEGAKSLDFSTPNANDLERDKNDLVTTTTTSNPVHESEFALQENNGTFYEEEAPQTVSISTVRMGIEEEMDLGPVNRSNVHLPFVLTDNSQPQEQQQCFDSGSNSEQGQGDGKHQEFNQEFLQTPTAHEEVLSDEADFLPHSPPPFKPWIVKIEATSSQPLEYFHPKPPTVRKKQQPQEPISESTRFENQEAEEGEKAEQLEADGLKQIKREFQEQQPARAEVLSPSLSIISSTSSSNRGNNLEKWDLSSPRPPTKLSQGGQSPESGEIIISPIARSSQSSIEITKDDFSKPFTASRKRKMSSPSPSSIYTDTVPTQRALKVKKESGKSPASSSSTLETFWNFGSHSDLNNRTNTSEYPSSPCAAASTESKLFSEGSILNVPEMYRSNYGFSNNFFLDLCPHARDFWYDSVHISSTKYFIRLFDDDFGKWMTTRKLTIKEQIGLAEPTVFHLSFEEIVQRLGKNMKKPGGIRIWLDVRDWNIFSHTVSQFFEVFGPSVTHFSFGRRLYSFEEVGADYLLDFIFKNLSNVEYLAFNDGSMKRLDSRFKLPSGVRDHSLKKLKTLRFLTVGFRFDTPFIMAILLRAPVLSSIYGIPLHLLEEIENQLLKKSKGSFPWLVKYTTKSSSKIPEIRMSNVKTVEVVRTLYNQKNEPDERHCYYPMDLIRLWRLCPSLEELDTRVFFVVSRKARKWCQEKLTEILQLNAHSLKLLKIEPLEISDCLAFPRLENCETLQFDMSTRLKVARLYGHRYFPRGMNFSQGFPNLKTVEISLHGENAVQNSLKARKAIDLFDAHFPSDAFHPLDTLATVQRLNLINFAHQGIMEKFRKLLPNITILGLNHTFQVLSEILPNCFRLWPKLKQLILDLNYSSYMEENLDSAFTGIPKQTCKILEKLGAKDVQARIIKNRNKPAISNLKELELLKIVLFAKGRIDSKTSGCFMTPVSAIYGFGKEIMPNLNVIVGLDDRLSSEERSGIIKLLKPMKPYLAIDE